MSFYFEEEKMSDIFTKYHIAPGAALHDFKEAEPITADAHDHPGSFTSMILDGWYLEKVWMQDSTGRWYSVTIKRSKGQAFHVPADRIHQIIEMSAGGCKTSTVWGPEERKWRFWRFDNGKAQWRENGQDDWIDF